MIKCKASKYSLYDYTTWMISVIPKPYVPAHWELQWSSSMEWIINEWILVDRHTERERQYIHSLVGVSDRNAKRSMELRYVQKKTERHTSRLLHSLLCSQALRSRMCLFMHMLYLWHILLILLEWGGSICDRRLSWHLATRHNNAIRVPYEQRL